MLKTTRNVGRIAGMIRHPVGMGISINVLNLVVILGIQVASIPIFINAVGVDAYGQWLVLTAIPTYLSLTDLGFSAAAATFATRQVLRLEYRKANATLNTARLLVSGLALSLILLLVSALIIGIDTSSLSAFDGHADLALAILGGCVFMQMQSGFYEAVLRSGGKYPSGLATLIAGRVLEFTLTTAALTLEKSLMAAVAAVLIARVSTLIAAWLIARVQAPWYRWSATSFSTGWLRRLLAPSLTYAGLPIGAALVNQGLILMVGALADASAVVAFATIKTAVSSIQQLNNVLNNGLLPTLTASLASSRAHEARRLFLRGMAATLCAVSVAATTLVVAGPTILSLWTGGAVTPSRWLLAAFAVSAVADAPWQSMLNLLRSANAHGWTALTYVGSASLSVAAAALLLQTSMGLLAIPLSTMLIDIFVTPVAWLACKNLLNHQPHRETPL